MREILFRGKRIDNGKWVYGYYAPCCLGRFPCSPCIVPDPDGIWEPIEVDPFTIGQYTGLTDKNGKEIFEGDIISVPGSKKPGLPGIVIFHQLDAKYILFRQRYSYLNLINVNEWGYVIGNIHDNPELLKDKHDD